MELTYIVIALSILILPIALTKLLSGRSRDTKAAPAATPVSKRAPPATAGTALRVQVEGLLVQGGKMEAIKLMRDKTGLPLQEAKEAVETIARDAAILAPAPSLVAFIQRAQEMSEEVRKLAASGQKIEAIKLIRERTGLGLKEAKDLVDRLG